MWKFESAELYLYVRGGLRAGGSLTLLLLGLGDGAELYPGIPNVVQRLGNGLLGLLQLGIHILVAGLVELLNTVLGLGNQLLAALFGLAIVAFVDV